MWKGCLMFIHFPLLHDCGRNSKGFKKKTILTIMWVQTKIEATLKSVWLQDPPFPRISLVFINLAIPTIFDCWLLSYSPVNSVWLGILVSAKSKSKLNVDLSLKIGEKCQHIVSTSNSYFWFTMAESVQTSTLNKVKTRQFEKAKSAAQWNVGSSPDPQLLDPNLCNFAESSFSQSLVGRSKNG